MKKTLQYILITLVSLIVLAVLFFAIRQRIANTEIERETQVVPTVIPTLGTTNRLEILPLYEEGQAAESLLSGHGVSYLIRTDSATILMDLGNSADDSVSLPALQNMQKLGIAWQEVDAIVISHPHPDHVGGSKAWQNKTVSFGDFTGDLRKAAMYTPIPMTYPGVTIVYSSEPTLISQDTATTGVIPFPEVSPLSLVNPKQYEQALVIHVAGEGLVVITGCGHPTLETLVTRAEELFGEDVIGVVGGLHYLEASAEDLQPHIQFLAQRQLRFLAISPHDSSPQVLEVLRSAFPQAYQTIEVGKAIQFP